MSSLVGAAPPWHAGYVTLVRFVLNVLWLIFAGFWLAVGYFLAGILCCILIITIPFGIASFRIGAYVLWPFGREVVAKPGAGAPSLIGNIIWVIFAGFWLAIGHLVTSIPLFVSIIGIPFGWANLKLIPVSLMPLGREIVSSEHAFVA
ncbi:YccF domain-containing protein [Nocardia nova]|uniref:YccF domain-containing protein n=1 Tax=Nocardia nova TaxID=37330 RepID=A0A2S6AXV4_9NOCA|nr:YccF domain-containing protein [Nocardia nova]PPJ40004.1 YccF domain-containing protein [Nocardia nova]